MTRYLSRWTAVLGWMVLMTIVWALFSPRGLSVGTFTLLILTGPVVVVAGSAFFRAQRPSSSVGQILAELERAKTVSTVPR